MADWYVFIKKDETPLWICIALWSNCGCLFLQVLLIGPRWIRRCLVLQPHQKCVWACVVCLMYVSLIYADRRIQSCINYVRVFIFKQLNMAVHRFSGFCHSTPINCFLEGMILKIKDASYFPLTLNTLKYACIHDVTALLCVYIVKCNHLFSV